MGACAGVYLSKDLMSIAGHALKANITTLGPLVLPISEQLLFFINLVMRKAGTLVPPSVCFALSATSGLDMPRLSCCYPSLTFRWCAATARNKQAPGGLHAAAPPGLNV